MNDIYTTAINTQKATTQWMDILADNLTNVYSPGFRESKVNFKTFLGGAVIDHSVKNFGQGKSTPGTSNENVFFFAIIYLLVKRLQGQSSTMVFLFLIGNNIIHQLRVCSGST